MQSSALSKLLYCKSDILHTNLFYAPDGIEEVRRPSQIACV